MFWAWQVSSDWNTIERVSPKFSCPAIKFSITPILIKRAGVFSVLYGECGMRLWKQGVTTKLMIFLAALVVLLQMPFAVAKFGEAPPVKGQVKCCFGKGGGFLSGRCLEMLERECTLKRGMVVKDCKECEGREKDKREKR